MALTALAVRPVSSSPRVLHQPRPAPRPPPPPVRFVDIPGDGVDPQGQRRSPRPPPAGTRRSSSRPAGASTTWSTWPRPRPWPAAATSSSRTRRAAGGPPAARSTPPGRRTWPTCPRSSTGRSRTPPPTRPGSARPASPTAPGSACSARPSTSGSGRSPCSAAGPTWSTRSTATRPGTSSRPGCCSSPPSCSGNPGPDLAGKLADFNANRNIDEVHGLGPGPLAGHLPRRDQRQPPGRADRQRLGRLVLPAQPTGRLLRPADHARSASNCARATTRSPSSPACWACPTTSGPACTAGSTSTWPASTPASPPSRRS